jgi:hypothetical protein
MKGWATPCANPANSTPEAFLDRKRKSIEKTGRSMGGIVLSDLNMQAQYHMRGWATPRQRDYKGNGVSIDRAAKGVADSLDLQCKMVSRNGMELPSPLSARMDTAALPLNPMHSLWLMGYSKEWESCGEVVTPSSRKSRKRS